MLWNEAKQKDAQELISWLLDSKPGPNAWNMDRRVMIGLVELAYSAVDSSMTDQTVMEVLDRMYGENQSLVADFEAHYKRLKQEQSSAERAGQADWTFYIPLEVNVTGTMRTRRLRFLDRTVELLPVNRVLSGLPPHPAIVRSGKKFSVDGNAFFSIIGSEAKFHPGAFLKLLGKGLDQNTAWENAEPVFSALRGLLEFSVGFGSGRLTIGGTSEPRCQIPHPAWLFAVGADDFVHGIAFDIDDEKRSFPFELTSERWGVLRRNAGILRNTPPTGSTQSVIADSLRLYAEAMDARFAHQSLLGFWQVGEAITLSEMVGGQTDKVAERLSWHHSKLKLPGSGYTATLKRLGQKRNSIVHRGIHDVGDTDVNIMKLACDIALLWLMQIRTSLPTTKHLAEFYRLRDANTAVLEALKGAVALIGKDRT